MATNISTTFPDVVLTPGCTITITLSDSNGRISKLNVYTYSPGRGDDSDNGTVSPIFSYLGGTSVVGS